MLRPDPDKGLTLLELIVSITIIGIIVLIITGAMQIGFRSIESGENRIESLERLRSSLNIIDAQIQSEFPLVYEEEGERKYYFTGNRGFMQFATNYSMWGIGQGYVIATYTVEMGEYGKQVLYASENIVGIETARTVKLFDRFDAIFFEYFYKDPTEEEGEWVEEWTNAFAIPEKIKIHLVEGMRDFSMIIPIRTIGSLSQSGANISGVPITH